VIAHDELAEAWGEATALLRAFRDVVVERQALPGPPAWAVRRRWTAFVDGLPESVVDEAGRVGLERSLPEDAPADLRALAEASRRIADRLAAAPAPSAVSARGTSPRKGSQIAAFAEAVAELAARSARVVDVGSGHGHLTRHLARVGGRPVLGLEIDPARVAVAARRAEDEGLGPVEFATCDVLAEGLALRRGDLAVGLHACGALGDALVVAAAEAGAGVALVSCCFQKVRGAERVPLSADDAALRFPRSVMSLAHRTPGEQGVAGTLDERRAARRRRLALHLLLRARGLDLAQGDEMRGINRRQAYGDLASLAFRAWPIHLPGAAPATSAELSAASRAADVADHALSRYGAVRSMLSRPLEAFVVLDRARVLAAAGGRVTVRALFPPAVSPRNLLLLADPRN
jgi:SAM-dependent methyltransferase